MLARRLDVCDVCCSSMYGHVCVCVFVWVVSQPCELGMNVMSLPLSPPVRFVGTAYQALPDPNLLAFIGLLSKRNTPNSRLIFNKQKMVKKKTKKT